MARHLLSIAAAVAGLTLTGPAVAAGLHDVPAPSDAPETLTAIIEIPAGTDVKYEIDADGRIFVDRFMVLPVVYPANYGSIARTEAHKADHKSQVCTSSAVFCYKKKNISAVHTV